jgi:hypothetical protein
MHTYEEVIRALHFAVAQSGLRVIDEQSWIDTVSLERNYRAVIVLIGDPPPHRIRAELSFPWPAEYTVESTHGPTCCMYHGPEERCPHQILSPEAVAAIDIRYLLDVHDAAAAPEIGERVRALLEKALQYESAPEIHFSIAEGQEGPIAVNELSANTIWDIDVVDAIDMAPAIDEINRVLAALLGSGLLPKEEQPPL